MKIDVLTLFPNMFTGFLNESIMARAIKNEKVKINLIDFREFADNKHKKVDDYPFNKKYPKNGWKTHYVNLTVSPEWAK